MNQSLAKLANKAQLDPSLSDKLKTDPVGTLNALAVTSVTSGDVWIYRTCVMGLVVLAFTALIGSIVIAIKQPDKEIPPILLALGSAAVGALGGVLVPTSKD